MENNEEYLALAKQIQKGFIAYCGVELEAVSTGFCRAGCPLEEKLLNPYGMAHGGASATLMDTAAGVAAIFSGSQPRSVLTQCAELHYLRPVRGQRMTCEARVLKAGRHTGLVRADLWGDDGKLAVTGEFEIFFTDTILE